MSEQVPAGYYRDLNGKVRRDRRRKDDRRSTDDSFGGEDRRNKMRRTTDHIDVEREHHEMIEEALEEFAAEHRD